MRLVAAVLLGMFVTYVLAVVGEEAAMSLREKGALLPFFESVILFPLIALIVGSLIGLLARNKARLAAILVFAPYAICVLLETPGRHVGLSWWVILFTLVSIYLGLGIGAAVVVSGRVNRSVVPGSA
jgi:hypothetical protein